MLEKIIKSFDNIELFSQVNRVNNSKAVVILVHGLAEHSDRYQPLTDFLNTSGYTVYRYDLRGHGRSKGKTTYLSNFNELPDDLYTVVTLAKQENPQSPIYLIGHSMGGFTVSLFGAKYPNEVAGIISSSALTNYSKEVFGSLPISLPTDTYLPNHLSEGVATDPAVIEDYINDPLVAKEVSVGLLNQLGEGIEWLKQNAHHYHVPVLILHGSADGIISDEDSRKFFGQIASEDKELHIYPQLMHELFNEPQKYTIYEEIVTWLDKHIN